MKNTSFVKLLIIIILVAFIGIYLFSLTVKTNKIQSGKNSLNYASSVTITLPVHKCKSVNALPDVKCTPGEIDPNVNQGNIQNTICMPGYTKKVRPPTKFTNELKITQIIDYGYEDTNPSDYEEDHLISLELGGSPDDPKNLWPEPGASPNDKDKIENLCHKKVCNGELLLTDAQREIASDWKTACQ